MENCLIEANIAGGEGGGVYGSPTMINCVVKGNGSRGLCAGDGDRGGGVYATSDACLLVDCLIEQNSAGAGYEGGGVYGPATLVRCLVARNRIPSWCCIPQGGGVFGAKLLEGCTIVDNDVYPDPGGYPGTGGGISKCTEVVNCIIWGNHPDQVEAPSAITYSCVQDGFPGSGNTGDNPAFLNFEGADYRVHPISPCIDTGDPQGSLDLDGTRADMGAFPLDQYPTCVPAKAPVAATLPWCTGR
jgi:hypothetical protein